MIASLLNLVRPKKPVQKAPLKPSPAPLPAKLLTALIGLDALKNRRLDDRRRRPRLDRAGGVSIVVALPGGTKTFDVHVRDMSAEGISFEGAVSISKDTQFTIMMPFVNGEGSVTLTYSVRRCEPLPDGRFLIGAGLLHYIADIPPLTG